MDAEVPRLMGVSKAILENVIFCHQEEANWPLAEPSALKKKFDDIFEASKFTKALDHIKSIRKDQNASLKVDQERLTHLKNDRDKATKLREFITEERKKLLSKENAAGCLEEEVKRLTRENQEFYKKATSFTAIFEKAQSLQNQKEMYEGNQQSLKRSIKLLTDSDEDLEQQLANFERHTQELSQRQESKQRLRDRSVHNLQSLRARQTNDTSNLGMRRADRKTYDENVNRRMEMIALHAKSLEIQGYSASQLDESAVESFLDLLKSTIESLSHQSEKIKLNGRKVEVQLNDQLNSLKTQRSTCLQLISDRTRQLNSTQSTIRSFESEMDSYSSADIDVKNLEQEIAETMQTITRARDQFAAENYDQRLRDMSLKLRVMESERESWGKEYSELMRQGDNRVKLDLVREKIKGLETQLSGLVEANQTKMKDLVGVEFKSGDVRAKMEAAQKMNQATINEQEQEVQDMKAQSVRTTSELQGLHRTIDDIQRDHATISQSVKEAIEEPGYTSIEQAVTFIKKDVAEKEKANNYMAGQAEFFEKLLNTEERQERGKKKCMGCNRKFANDSELADFRAHAKKRIEQSKTNEHRLQMEQELKELREQQTLFQDLASKWSEVERKRQQQVPELETKVEAAEESIAKLAADLEDYDARLQKARQNTRDLESLERVCQDIARYTSEANSARQDAQDLERALASMGSTKTPEEVQGAMQDLDRRIKMEREQEYKLKADRDHANERVRQRETELERHRVALAEAKIRQAKRQESERKLHDLNEAAAKYRQDIQASEKENTSLDGPIRSAQEKLATHIETYTQEHSQVTTKYDKMRIAKNELDGVTRSILSYEHAGGDVKLREAEQAVEAIKHQISDAENEMETIQQDIATIAQQASESDNRRATINSNLRFREAERMIAKLEDEINQIDIDAAAKAKRDFESRYERMEAERTDKHAKHQQLVGEISQIKENLQRQSRQLASEYKNIQDDYNECLVKFKTGQMASADLDKYGKALDNAIMQYHSLKMQEVNDCLQELWHEVYTGTGGFC